MHSESSRANGTLVSHVTNLKLYYPQARINTKSKYRRIVFFSGGTYSTSARYKKRLIVASPECTGAVGNLLILAVNMPGASYSERFCRTRILNR